MTALLFECIQITELGPQDPDTDEEADPVPKLEEDEFPQWRLNDGQNIFSRSLGSTTKTTALGNQGPPGGKDFATKEPQRPDFATKLFKGPQDTERQRQPMLVRTLDGFICNGAASPSGDGCRVRKPSSGDAMEAAVVELDVEVKGRALHPGPRCTPSRRENQRMLRHLWWRHLSLKLRTSHSLRSPRTAPLRIADRLFFPRDIHTVG